MNTYETTFSVKCPNDDEAIEYTVVIESDHTIMVEDINAYTGSLDRDYHEALADKISRKFHGKQTITAVHQGVKITTNRKRESRPHWSQSFL